MDQFVYSLNGTVVVYGYDNFDGLVPKERNDAVLLPKRIAANESDLDDSAENSFCTVPHITFDDLRTNFKDPEFDIVDGDADADGNSLRNVVSTLSPDYYAKSSDATQELSFSQQRNDSIANDAFTHFYSADNCAPTHTSRQQPCIAINILLYFLLYNYRTRWCDLNLEIKQTVCPL